MPHEGKLLPLLSSGARAANDGRAFAQQECLLIALNLFALIALLCEQTLFRQITDPSSFGLVAALFLARIIEQSAELVWLKWRGATLTPTAAWFYGRASIVINIAFAAIVSLAANSVDAHYSVLLTLPLIAAGFRLSLPGVLLVVLIASGLAFLETWVYFLRHPPVDVEEFFEAATVVLVYVVVGLVVWGMTRSMRRNAQQLEMTIDALERTQDRLVEEEKLAAVGRLASSIAHEIRNPVGMIASALQTAQKPDLRPELRQEFSEIAAKEAMRLEKVTSDFLSYARTKAPEKQPVSACGMLAYIAGLTKARAADDGPRVEVQCAEDIELMVDQFQMHQGLINLALNALQHSPPGGRVTLGAARNGAMLELFVENEGTSIDEAAAADIFEPFYTTRPSGAGLGLPISRNIARAHGGDLILSRNEQGAVRFSIRIPKD